MRQKRQRESKRISAGLHKSIVNIQRGLPTLEQRQKHGSGVGSRASRSRRAGPALQLRAWHPAARRLSDDDVDGAGTPTGLFSGSLTGRTYNRPRKCVLSKGAPHMFWRKHKVVHVISPVYWRTRVNLQLVLLEHQLGILTCAYDGLQVKSDVDLSGIGVTSCQHSKLYYDPKKWLSSTNAF